MRASSSRLLFAVEPIPGEGMSDLLLRATAENCLGKVAYLMKSAGLAGFHAGSAGTGVIGLERSLAEALGPAWTAADIEAIAYSPASGERQGKFHNWFGTVMRRHYRMARTRRVSPRSLALTLSLKAVWSLKPLCFDPDTLEYLIADCPVCRRPLGFAVALGVQYCDRCSVLDKEGFVRGAVDLRDYPQDIVEVDDMEALTLVTRLVSHCPNVRASAMSSLPSQFAGYEAGDVFDLCISLGGSLTTDAMSNKRVPDGFPTNDDFKRLTPQVLSKLGRMLLTWPSGFHEVLDDCTNLWSVRSGLYGRYKLLGPIYDFRIAPRDNPVISALVGPEIDRFLDKDGIREKLLGSQFMKPAGKLRLKDSPGFTGVSLKVVNNLRKGGLSFTKADSMGAPVLIGEVELQDAVEKHQDYISLHSVAKALNAPELAVESLAEAGLIDRNKSYIAGRPDGYSRASIEGLLANLTKRAARTKPPRGLVGLATACSRLGSPHSNPWRGLLAAMLDGTIEYWCVEGEKGDSPAYLSLSSLRSIVIAQEEWRCKPMQLTMQCSALISGWHYTKLYHLVRDGVLPKVLTLSCLQEFHLKYMSTREAYESLFSEFESDDIGQTKPGYESRLLRPLLQLVGLRPVLTFGKGNCLWAREDIMKAQAALMGCRSALMR